MKDHQEEVFFELHSGNRREGPGCFQSTAHAFEYLHTLPEKPLILDVGCGPGEQTIDLAKISNGTIYAIDIHDSMLNALKVKIIENNLLNRIRVFNMSMDSMSFERKFFDVIWGEGSIYNIGFEHGLKIFKPFLKQLGFIAVTEISWLSNERPEEITNYWKKYYPQINTIEKNIEIINKCGYSLIKNFTLPKTAWLDEYYAPLKAKIPALLNKYSDDSEAQEILNAELTEIEMYEKYSAFYGYEFYIMQKNKS